MFSIRNNAVCIYCFLRTQKLLLCSDCESVRLTFEWWDNGHCCTWRFTYTVWLIWQSVSVVAKSSKESSTSSRHWMARPKYSNHQSEYVVFYSVLCDSSEILQVDFWVSSRDTAGVLPGFSCEPRFVTRTGLCNCTLYTAAIFCSSVWTGRTFLLQRGSER